MAFPLKWGQDQHLTNTWSNIVGVGIETVHCRVAYNRIAAGAILGTPFKPTGKSEQSEL